jgi:hypothetical protein
MTDIDTTRRASSLVAGERVNDSQTYEQIIVTAVEADADRVHVLGRLARSNRPVSRLWWANDRVTDHGDVQPTPVERALVAVETAERVMRMVDECLTNFNGSDRAEVEQARAYARTALDEAMSETTDTTCSLVKGLALSDRISKAAAARVDPIRTHATQALIAVRVP